MARQLDVILNPDVIEAVGRELALEKEIRIRIRFSATAPPNRMGGILRKANLTPEIHQIFIETNPKLYRTASLFQTQMEARLTLLHELKHAQQHEQWSELDWTLDDALPYMMKRSEQEAEAFAKENYVKYKDILKIKPRQVGRKLP